MLVFDWKGDDYAPYFPGDVIRADEIILEMEFEEIAERLIERANYCGSSGPQGAMRYVLALTDALQRLNLDEVEGGGELKMRLLEETPRYIVNYASSRYAEENIRLFRNYFSRLSNSIFDECLRRMKEGRYTAEEVIEQARRGLKVIDLSGRESDEKLAIFLEIARILRYRMDVEKQRVGLALVIDEAPQYCPWGPTGLQRETTEIIVDLCALGRSYQLPIILLSQGIAGEIGINAAVRRNINTWFIGKVHPLDRVEAEKLLPDVDLEFLQSLDVGHFYFFGNMSPSPVPLLIRFEVEGDE